MEKKTHGGARKNAGRKKVKDKMVEVRVFVLGSRVKACGGIKKAKDAAVLGVLTRAESNSHKITPKGR